MTEMNGEKVSAVRQAWRTFMDEGSEAVKILPGISIVRVSTNILDRLFHGLIVRWLKYRDSSDGWLTIVKTEGGVSTTTYLLIKEIKDEPTKI